WVVGDVQ
nr:bioactive peptide P1=putative esophageal neuroregulator [Perinereis vancaurica, Peptide, 7 aa] [Perinereis vancaurica]